MYVIKTLPEFDAWLRGLSDKTAQRRLIARLRKASLGWRMYYTLRGGQLVVMLGGGSKSSQRTDITVAQRRAAMIEEG
jgi:putative component of toxin-antitoxin plasmid stabilization module